MGSLTNIFIFFTYIIGSFSVYFFCRFFDLCYEFGIEFFLTCRVVSYLSCYATSLDLYKRPYKFLLSSLVSAIIILMILLKCHPSSFYTVISMIIAGIMIILFFNISRKFMTR